MQNINFPEPEYKVQVAYLPYNQGVKNVVIHHLPTGNYVTLSHSDYQVIKNKVFLNLEPSEYFGYSEGILPEEPPE